MKTIIRIYNRKTKKIIKEIKEFNKPETLFRNWILEKKTENKSIENLLIEASNNFTLTVNPMTSFLAVAYLWDFGDGTTSTLATPSHIYTVDTVYNVCLKIYTANGDSCEYCHIIGKDYLGNIYRTVGFTINVQNNLTVNSPNVEQNETKIIIYPNPFTSQTTISFSEESRTNGTGNQHTIKIMNLLGECIQQLTTNNKQLILDMSDVAKGIYFVRIEDTSTGSATENKKVVNRKIIIQ